MAHRVVAAAATTVGFLINNWLLRYIRDIWFKHSCMAKYPQSLGHAIIELVGTSWNRCIAGPLHTIMQSALSASQKVTIHGQT